MKNLKIIGLVLVSIFLFSCQKPYWPFDEKPNVLTAEYEIVTNGEFERGYNVYVKLENSEDFTYVYHLIVNGFEFENKEGTLHGDGILEIEGYFPIQSKLIQNFESPLRVEKEDGIIFGGPDNQYFYPVKFKLKKK